MANKACFRNVDDIFEAISLRRAFDDLSLIPQLIDCLVNTPLHVADEAHRILYASVPMATLPERWVDDSHPPQGDRQRIPKWINELCAGWGDIHDFTGLCAEKLASLSNCDQEQFLDRMATFPGAQRLFAQRLRSMGLSKQARHFSRKVLALRRTQFPMQIGLSPTMTCQLKCGYCIASGNTSDVTGELPFVDAVSILQWCIDCGVSRLGLTGGEPTLYSEFPKLLEHAKQMGLEVFLATNGLGSLSCTRAIIRSKPLCVTMHLTPETLSGRLDTYRRNARAMIEAGLNVALRCNFADPSSDPTPYVRIASELGIREIRAAIPMPNASRYNMFIEHGNLEAFSDVLERYVGESVRLGLLARLAKPFPLCKLSRETAGVFLANGSMTANCPVNMLGFSNNLTVYPDLRFSSCLGLDTKFDKSIMQFRSPRHAALLFRRQAQAIMTTPLLKECLHCPLGRGGRCIGACLSYRL